MIHISVCMATYNGSQFIECQLSSILKQLSLDDEIIVSDDGSIDDTLHIINNFSDCRIKVFNNTSRHGIVGNFENALKHASGQLIFLADQDDIWLPNKVTTTCSLLTNCDLVLTNCEVIDQIGNVLRPSFFEYRGSQPGFWLNLYRNSYIGCCMAFRREVLDYILPFPTQIDVHDWWIGLIVEAKGRVVFCEVPLIKYVRHGNNASPTGDIGYSLSKKIMNRYFLLFNVAKRLLM